MSLFVGLYAEPMMSVCKSEHLIFRNIMSQFVWMSTGSLMMSLFINKIDLP